MKAFEGETYLNLHIKFVFQMVENIKEKEKMLETSFSPASSNYIFVCLGFYAVSTVFYLFNGDSSQIDATWTISNQYLTNPLS